MKLAKIILVIGTGLVLLLILDLGPLLVSDAYAIAGVRRRTARRTAVVVGSTSAAQAPPPQEAAPPPPPPPPPAAPPAAAPGALPLGATVTALPAGCPSTTINNVEYYSCGGNYYRAAFQGSQLIYVTTQP
jgi:hypothetical protein